MQLVEIALVDNCSLFDTEFSQHPLGGCRKLATKVLANIVRLDDLAEQTLSQFRHVNSHASTAQLCVHHFDLWTHGILHSGNRLAYVGVRQITRALDPSGLPENVVPLRVVSAGATATFFERLEEEILAK